MDSIGKILIRLVVSALALRLVSYLVPGFSVAGFWTALVAAIVISLIGFGVEALFGKGISPYARGLVGFLVSAIVIYIAGRIVSGFNVTFLGALIASFIVGLVDMLVPTTIR